MIKNGSAIIINLNLDLLLIGAFYGKCSKVYTFY
jgi:hypothetical protein